MTVQQHPGLKRFIPTPLKRVLPVPSDIEIAQAATLKPITTIAEEMGVLTGGTGNVWSPQSQGQTGDP